MSETVYVTLTQSPVELYKILKFEGVAPSGAEAKMMIDDGLVKVNGEVELRKRKKIISGDKVQVADIMLIIDEA
jgi:ribosome-associated protein